jgi:hypothetical protein
MIGETQEQAKIEAWREYLVMRRLLRWGLPIALVVVVLGLAVRNHYVLDSRKLDAAIKAELPPGTPKPQVIKFIQEWNPQFCDDLGTHEQPVVLEI